MAIFSKRHKNAIYEKKVRPSFAISLRKRIWLLMQKHDYVFYETSDTGFNYSVSCLQKVEKELLLAYGADVLIAQDLNSGEQKKVNLEYFVIGAYPSQVLDVGELFFEELNKNSSSYEECISFRIDLNKILVEEESPWRLVDGQFFRVDSQFLESEVVAKAYHLLQAKGFEGALEEFKNARVDFTAGDCKDAIHKCGNALESVMKTILGKDRGNAKILIEELCSTDIFNDLPAGFGTPFGNQVLMSLPFLRNRLGGHGQGEEVVDVPSEYAELAIHLCASFILFLGKKATKSADEG